jgi:hypothetical protein
MPSTTLPGVVVRATNATNRSRNGLSCSCWLIESPLPDVRDHAHHRQPVALIAHAHASAERLGRTTGKVFAHDALADDRHFQRCRRVL